MSPEDDAAIEAARAMLRAHGVFRPRATTLGCVFASIHQRRPQLALWGDLTHAQLADEVILVALSRPLAPMPEA